MWDKVLTLKETLDLTVLIQRLHAPSQVTFAGKTMDNPFTFGGGLKNGGLSEEAMVLLRGIFSFDYMGAAEFEFGAVPNAIAFILKQAQAGGLCVGEVDFSKVGHKGYYVCPRVNKDEVIERLILLYKGKDSYKNSGAKIDLKCWCGLNRYFAEDAGAYAKRNLGWLELNNGFAFFVDRDMFIKFVTLFGIDYDKEAEKGKDKVKDKVKKTKKVTV